MLECLLRNYNITFKMLIDYVKELECQDLSLISDDCDPFCREIKMRISKDLLLSIISICDETKLWLTFYYYDEKLGHNISQLNFIMYDEKYATKHNDGLNNVITYHYIDVRGDIANIVNSGYTYRDDLLDHGWCQKKEVLYRDVKHLMHDNLANLNLNITSEKINIISSSDETFNRGYQLIL